MNGCRVSHDPAAPPPVGAPAAHCTGTRRHDLGAGAPVGDTAASAEPASRTTAAASRTGADPAAGAGGASAAMAVDYATGGTDARAHADASVAAAAARVAAGSGALVELVCVADDIKPYPRMRIVSNHYMPDVNIQFPRSWRRMGRRFRIPASCLTLKRSPRGVHWYVADVAAGDVVAWWDADHAAGTPFACGAPPDGAWNDEGRPRAGGRSGWTATTSAARSTARGGTIGVAVAHSRGHIHTAAADPMVVSDASVATATAAAFTVREGDGDCIVCAELLPTVDAVAIVPCGHAATCLPCLNALRRFNAPRHAPCPICRGPISAIVRASECARSGG